MSLANFKKSRMHEIVDNIERGTRMIQNNFPLHDKHSKPKYQMLGLLLHSVLDCFCTVMCMLQDKFT